MFKMTSWSLGSKQTSWSLGSKRKKEECSDEFYFNGGVNEEMHGSSATYHVVLALPQKISCRN